MSPRAVSTDTATSDTWFVPIFVILYGWPEVMSAQPLVELLEDARISQRLFPPQVTSPARVTLRRAEVCAAPLFTIAPWPPPLPEAVTGSPVRLIALMSSVPPLISVAPAVEPSAPETPAF